MGALRRLFERLAQTDEVRHAAEIRNWARSVPGTVPIAEAGLREKARVAGVVRRITVLPMEGGESLRLLLSDGAGECEVVLMGRRSLPGLSLGTRLVVEGVVAEQRGMRRIVNPKVEFGR
jgi:hypothetical protein